ncbi:hypothetical protein IE4872_PD00188 (plasmid) [Rhizobium gallicum]|uniref:Integrase catalytic domain-containing protein n=1 Tax=Rhizobium gallicum TaxID=56730 RepID=A0A1L5NSB0_9HYPH|nr:hypothetical protein IE4872_PD00188 [Rhizobium gallicum]
MLPVPHVPDGLTIRPFQKKNSRTKRHQDHIPDNGQVEKMNRMIKDAVRRFHYENHDQLRQHLADFVAAYNFGGRHKTLNGLTPTSSSAKFEPHSPNASPLIHST